MLPFFQITTARLVDRGIIDPLGFYVYLRAWRSYDGFNYTSPPCVLFPDPEPLFLPRFEPSYGRPEHLKVVFSAAKPLDLVQTSFYASGYGRFSEQIEFVKVSSLFLPFFKALCVWFS